jgi:hypothetical protein
MNDTGDFPGAGKGPFDSGGEHEIHERSVTVDEGHDPAEMKGTWVPIHAPVGPWHSPQEIRAWIRRLETKRAEDAEDHGTNAVDAALEQARGWLGYAEKRWAMGRKPRG